MPMRNPIYFTALKTIWIKECTSFFCGFGYTNAGPPAITMTLYFIIFGSPHWFAHWRNGWCQFIWSLLLPGLIMMSVITNAYSNVASSFFSAKFQRNLEEMLVAPVSNITIILGYVGGGVARALLVAIIVTLVSGFFVPLQNSKHCHDHCDR